MSSFSWIDALRDEVELPRLDSPQVFVDRLHEMSGSVPVAEEPVVQVAENRIDAVTEPNLLFDEGWAV